MVGTIDVVGAELGLDEAVGFDDGDGEDVGIPDGDELGLHVDDVFLLEMPHDFEVWE